MKKASVAAISIAAVALATPTLAAEKAATSSLIGTPWIETKAQSGLPGPMMIFLPKGKLLIDSCWETYALRTWKQASSKEISWDEDGAIIHARIKAVSAVASPFKSLPERISSSGLMLLQRLHMSVLT